MMKIVRFGGLAAAIVTAVSATAGEPIACQSGDDLQVALAEARSRVDGGEDGVTIRLGPGTYSITSELLLDRPIAVESTDGPEATTIGQTTSEWAGDSRVVNITSVGARVAGVTMTIPQFTIKKSSVLAFSGGIVSMTADGVVSNCVLRGPGVEAPIGTQNHFTQGGGVYMTAGLVADTVISNCAFSTGAGISMTGGTVSGCTVCNCRAGNRADQYTGGMGAGIRIDGASAVVTNCLVAGCTSTYFPGVGVALFSGRLVDSRIVGNSMRSGAAANNAQESSAENEGLGVFQLGGSVVDCVIAENRTRSGVSQDWFGDAGTIAGTQLGRYAPGEGNVPRVPLFADSANGDWTILPSFTASIVDALPGTEVSFAAEDVEGAGFSWDFGDGATATGATAAHSYSGTGAYTVTLSYEKDGVRVSRVRTDFIRVYGSAAYVEANAAAGAFPYDAPEKATSDAVAAIDAVRAAARLGVEGPVAHIGEGTYGIVSSIEADAPFRVEGADPETTRLWVTNHNSRALRMTHSGAVVSGVSLRGLWKMARKDAYAFGPGSRYGVGVRMSAGTITNCVVEGCEGGSLAWTSRGVGVYMTGGSLVDSAIRDCCANNNSNGAGGHGAGAYATAGLIDRCRIVGNVGGGQYWGGEGVGVYADGTAMVRNSLVAGNVSRYRAGAGIYANSRNVLVENCTIVSNRTDAGNLGAGVALNGGTLRNSIVYFNPFGSVADDVDRIGSAANIVTEYVCSSVELSGTGNIVSEPSFADIAAGDYHLKVGSPCIDAGVNTEAALAGLDLDRGTRVLDGSGAGRKVVDMGCYEFVLGGDGLTATFVVRSGGTGLGDTIATFEALVLLDGEPVSDFDGYEFEWDFGDGTTQSGSGGDYAVAYHKYIGGQRRNVSLVVRHGGESTEPFVRTDCVSVYSTDAYVSATGSATFPYDSWERATPSLADAFSVVSFAGKAIDSAATLHVGDGVFPASQAFDFDFPCEIVGNGPGRSRISSGVQGTTMIRLSADGCVLSGLSLTDAQSIDALGGALSVVSDSIVTNCVFSGNDSSGHGHQGRGGAVYAEKGLIVDCSMINNGLSQYNSTVYLTGTVLMDRCVITNNYGGYRYHCYGGAGVTVGNGWVTNRNCLIAHNRNRDRPGAGIYHEGGYSSFENCTIADNSVDGVDDVPEFREKPAGVLVNNGWAKLVNCVVCDNSNKGAEMNFGDPSNAGYSHATYCAIPGLAVGEGNISVRGEFVDKSAGDYRPTKAFAANARGCVLEWMPGALDLAGNPRLRGRSVHMGCYTGDSYGLFVIVR